MFHVSGTLQHLFAGFYWDANTYHTDICLPISYGGHLRLFVWKWLSMIARYRACHQEASNDFRWLSHSTAQPLNLRFASPVPRWSEMVRDASVTRLIASHPVASKICFTRNRPPTAELNLGPVQMVLTRGHFQDLKWLPPALLALLVLGVQTFFHETYQGIWNASSSPIPPLSSPHVLETPVKSCKHIEVRSLPWTPLRTCHGCTSTFDLFQQA